MVSGFRMRVSGSSRQIRNLKLCAREKFRGKLSWILSCYSWSACYVIVAMSVGSLITKHSSLASLVGSSNMATMHRCYLFLEGCSVTWLHTMNCTFWGLYGLTDVLEVMFSNNINSLRNNKSSNVWSRCKTVDTQEGQQQKPKITRVIIKHPGSVRILFINKISESA